MPPSPLCRVRDTYFKHEGAFTERGEPSPLLHRELKSELPSSGTPEMEQRRCSTSHFEVNLCGGHTKRKEAAARGPLTSNVPTHASLDTAVHSNLSAPRSSDSDTLEQMAGPWYKRPSVCERGHSCVRTHTHTLANTHRAEHG